MDIRTKGTVYIICGIAVILIFASDFFVRLLFAIMGLYLIYTGLQMRSANAMFIHMSQIFHRFHR